MSLNVLDVIVVIAYFVSVIAIGIWVGTSLFASNIGSSHFIGLAGSAASSGIAISIFEISVYTMPEYLKKRFGGKRIQLYLTTMTLFLYIFTKISSDLYAGSVFIDLALGLNIYIAVIILLAISAIFTIIGGLTAVIWTDFIQSILMVSGAFILMIMSFIKVGGFEKLIETYFNAIPETSRVVSLNSQINETAYKYTKCGLPTDETMHILRSTSDPALPWTGVIFGLTISNIWYWCTDQVIVQRTLSAKNLSHAKIGCLLAGVLKLLPLWLLVFPGMIARVLYPDSVACGDPDSCIAVCGKSRGCSDIAYPKLALDLLPQGLRGLMLAVMLASLISSLTSIFNSSSTLFTMDVWSYFRPRAKTTELLIVGRVSTLVLVGISVAWMPIVRSSDELFHYIQSVTSYLAPPVCVVFLLAIFWGRCNEKGAFASMMAGLLVGLTRFVWENFYPRLLCGEELTALKPGQEIITKVHYLHFSVLLFAICTLVAVCVSLATEPLPEKNTKGLTFWTRHINKKEEIESPPDSIEMTVLGLDQFTSTTKLEELNTCTLGDAIDQTNKAKLPDILAHKPWYVQLGYWVCGIEQTTQGDSGFQRPLSLKIQENPKTMLLTDFGALILLAGVAFMWGFFA